MIRLELVNKDNFDQVLDLEVAPKDQRRVASVEYSLAQAWLYRDSEVLFPYAVKSGQLTVGFLLLSYQPMENSYYIWRLLIDQKYKIRALARRSFGKCYNELGMISSAIRLP
ncbi:MAG TPA: hypothetical protein PLD31_00605 [Streptococcus parasuis]|nr:hypothetical protein [Streptococcus parasuis]